jgi:hypothetical protein
MKTLLAPIIALALIGMAFPACSSDASDQEGRPLDPGASGQNGAAPGSGGPGPGAAAPLPAPRIGLMGEAEITEYLIRQLSMVDDKGVVRAITYVEIGPNTYENWSFVAHMRDAVRSEYQNMMPNTRDLAVFSQTTAGGLFAIGSRVCVYLFNREHARPSRRELFGVDDFTDQNVPTAQRDHIFDVLIDRFAMSSGVDLDGSQADIKKIMQDEFDDAVTHGISPRNALEESCAVLLGSLAPYLL